MSLGNPCRHCLHEEGIHDPYLPMGGFYEAGGGGCCADGCDCNEFEAEWDEGGEG